MDKYNDRKAHKHSASPPHAVTGADGNHVSLWSARGAYRPEVIERVWS
jgi:hypothetical protein